ncbi:hypothetical protein T492DRAFT_1055822 [Pavlovales sp. CCMP2436]|nr:hypothetical protein T492DRAFT_1055822 [Pavlovales sp. CCMP2436]
MGLRQPSGGPPGALRGFLRAGPPQSLARGRRASCTPCQPSGACRRCRAPWLPRVSTASACAPWPPTWLRQTPGGSRAASPRPRE